MNEDLRIIIIKRNGNMVVIFSDENNECNNFIETNSVEEVKKYYNKIKNRVYKNNDAKDKHLFYLKDYLKNNFIEEFSNISINPQSINDDLLLYYFLSEFGNAVMVNSSEHINIAIIPNSGLSYEQSYGIKEIDNLFVESAKWEIANNMHFEIIEENGQKYKVLDVGETVQGNLKCLIEEQENKRFI